MAAGLVGVFGQAAASRAMQGHKEDHGAARIHDLEMAGNLAQGQRMNNAFATRAHVQVRKKEGDSSVLHCASLLRTIFLRH